MIAAIDGLATAGGCEIALAADLIVATRRSAFGLAEVKRNLIAGAGGLYRLPWAIGRGPALEAILTGEPIPAERAYELGLVTRLVDDGTAKEAALELAGKITEAAPLAVWASLEHREGSQRPRRRHAAQARPTRHSAAVLNSEDTSEGLTAFIEKRKPQWKGRYRRGESPNRGGDSAMNSVAERRRHDDQAGGDTRPFVQVLRLAVTGKRLALDAHAAASVPAAVAASISASPKPHSRASGWT